MNDLTSTQRWIPGFEGKYLCTRNGHVYRLLNDDKLKRLNGYRTKNRYVFKLTKNGISKEYPAAKVIWTAFRGDIPHGYIAVRKNRIISMNNLDNLRLETLSEHGKKTGALAKSKSVSLFENGELVNEWKSARKAAKDLFISYQTVMDICNYKVKKRMFDLRWSNHGRDEIKKYLVEKQQ